LVLRTLIPKRRDLDVESMVAPVATCARDGFVVNASAGAAALLRFVDAPVTDRGTHVPAALWSKLEEAEFGEAVRCCATRR
jgi:hypothetical protein